MQESSLRTKELDMMQGNPETELKAQLERSEPDNNHSLGSVTRCVNVEKEDIATYSPAPYNSLKKATMLPCSPFIHFDISYRPYSDRAVGSIFLGPP